MHTLTWEDRHGKCPKCKCNWDSGVIFDEMKKFYPGRTDEEIGRMSDNYAGGRNGHFSKLVGIEDPYVYDGTLYWQCPECKVKIQRFDNGSRLFFEAQKQGALTLSEIIDSRGCEICGYNGQGLCACEEG